MKINIFKQRLAGLALSLFLLLIIAVPVHAAPPTQTCSGNAPTEFWAVEDPRVGITVWICVNDTNGIPDIITRTYEVQWPGSIRTLITVTLGEGFWSQPISVPYGNGITGNGTYNIQLIENNSLITNYSVMISQFPTQAQQPQDPADDNGAGTDALEGSATEEVTLDKLNAVNPLLTKSTVGEAISTPGGLISRLLEFAIPLAGLLLFVMIVWGGFEILMGSTNKKSLDAGKNRITAAIIGFILLFSAYWIVRVIGVIFGITIL